MQLGYGTYSGIENVLFDGNKVEFAGVAIKISSFRGEGGRLRNISFLNTEILEAGIALNVDLATSNESNTSQLSTFPLMGSSQTGKRQSEAHNWQEA